MAKTKVFLVAMLVTAIISASIILAYSLRERTDISRDGGEKTAEEGQEGWVGIDEGVIEKYASESGREVSPPLLPVDNGDLILFFFTFFAFIAGCTVGYAWSRVMRPKEAGSKSA